MKRPAASPSPKQLLPLALALSLGLASGPAARASLPASVRAIFDGNEMPWILSRDGSGAVTQGCVYVPSVRTDGAGHEVALAFCCANPDAAPPMPECRLVPGLDTQSGGGPCSQTGELAPSPTAGWFKDAGKRRVESKADLKRGRKTISRGAWSYCVKS